MQDQGIPVGEGFVLDCGAQVTVPAMIVDWLRDAAYAEVGLAAEALDTVAFSRDREAHPEWFRGPAEGLKQICALLDAIGWAKSVPPDAVQLDRRPRNSVTSSSSACCKSAALPGDQPSRSGRAPRRHRPAPHPVLSETSRSGLPSPCGRTSISFVFQDKAEAPSYTQMLWMCVRRGAAYLPGC
jgi:hypothetical protein